ncbi:MAG: Abi family protein [Clostridiales Family XIII bacterium]|nr:Abi family protein [Clostridiales Family XIII bacterium]
MKTFSTFEQQIAHLETEKHLIFSDLSFAAETLMRIGYFALISGYKGAFKNPMTGNYKDGVRFEEIVVLYEFDEQLRELFFHYILRIERHLRSLISYYFCQKHGEQQAEYLNAANFTGSPKRANNVRTLIKILDHLANGISDYSYMIHHRGKYGNIPLWVLMSGVTFGSLAKFYDLGETDIRTKVSKHFIGVNETELGQFLSILTKFRNVCAHSERLFSYRTRNAITDMPLHAKMRIPRKGNQYIYGKKDLFAVVIAFRYLLPSAEFKTFKNALARTIRKYLANTAALTEAEMFGIIGFPSNWKSI